MLQRAASNAYSWWWASHIRTKQSKWLEQSLQDMEEKVQGMIKLIEEDGDSFAKRAEMYYKRRPELINFVEESFKSFRSLADRYDHLSKDLQNANNTIASVFPEQVQLMAELDDDSPTRKIPKKIRVPAVNAVNVPKVPKAPSKDLKGLFTTASKKIQAKKKSQIHSKLVQKSGLTKDQAVKEIDKLQKDILSMQTVKEYVKSSYESGVAKYWDIENQIVEMQQKVCSLQDEFNVESVIEDSEARTLMAEAALKSCQETLTQLEEKQERSTREAREEYKKIEDVCQRLKSLKSKFFPGFDEKKSSQGDQSVNAHETENSVGIKIEKRKRHSDLGNFTGSLTVTELAEKIDELVNKVIGLETDVSSQTILINTLRTETDELHAQIQNLENEKDTLNGDKKYLSNRLREMEEKLAKIQILNKNVERETSNLQTEFVKTSSSLGHLKDKLNSAKPDEELEETDTISPSKDKLLASPEYQIDVANPAASKTEDKEDVKEVVVMNVECPELLVQEKREETDKPIKKEVTCLEQKLKEEVHVAHERDSIISDECPELLVQEKREETDKPIKKEVTCLEQKLKEKREETDKPIKKEVTCLEQKLKEEVHVGHERDSIISDECPELLVQEKREETDKPIKKEVTFLEQKLKEEVHVGHEHDPIISDDAQGDTDKQHEQELNWQQMLSTTGTDDRDKIPLKEYTTILRNYKDVKKKLSDLEKKDRDTQFDITLQLREQKKAIQKRDEVIQRLLDKLKLQKHDMKADESDIYEDLEVNEALDTPMSEKAEENDSGFVNNQSISIVEEKLRMDIDAILDENLDFWLRFSTAFHQIQKFRTEVQDLQDEIEKLKEKKNQEGSSVIGGLKSEARPIYKHLREIQTELTVWLEQSVSLKDELKRRFASLCNIQEEITKALKKGAEEDEISFSSHQAAKFQGEILNMKQENNKVREELNAGLDHVSTLQLEIDKTLRKMNEEFDICDDQYELKGRSKVPLRSFIFGTKAKKQKPSIFSCMHPNKTYQILRAGIPRQITLE